MGDVMIGSEYAIISITDQREQIDMRLSVETVAQDSGLIFPTPEPATVSLGDEADFDAITSQMRPREVVHYDFWYLPFPGAAGPNGEGGAGAPVILSEVQLGPLRATTLAASDSDGLTAWLEDNGFMVRDEVEPLLRQYITKGWYFVALSLTNPDGLGGDLAPISFSFDLPADGPVYPLALSRAARIEQQVNLYVFADHQYDVAWEDPSAGDTLRSWPVWSGPVDQPTLERFGGWMTAFHLDFWDPAENIADDIAFYQASADEEIGTVYETVQPVTVFGIIGLGWVLIPAGLWLLAGLITLLARLFGRLINS
jgi:hypothetical protein